MYEELCLQHESVTSSLDILMWYLQTSVTYNKNLGSNAGLGLKLKPLLKLGLGCYLASIATNSVLSIMLRVWGLGFRVWNLGFRV